MDEDPLVGRVLKETYRVDKPLTDGGMSLVYLAWQLSLDRPVVLKLLRPGFNDQEFIDLFLREARISSQINHPNVVSVFDFGQTEDDIVYLAMELLEGETLDDLVGATGALPLPKVLWLMEQVCNGIHAAHVQDVVHRDLKPQNIMISKVTGDDTIAKVLDFGISKPLSEDDLKHTRLGMVMGTPGFLAPEQIEGQRQIDPRADIYAAGAILYFCMTGVAPFKGANREIIMNKQLDGKLAPLNSFENIDPACHAIQPIIDKAMHQDKDKRYQSIRNLWEELYAIGAQNAVQSRSIPNETLAAVTQYQFVVTGKRLDGFDEALAKAALSKALKLNDKKWAALSGGKRLIVRKNMPLENAERFKKLFDKYKLGCEIEEMADATRIAPKNQTSPTMATIQAVTLNDIQGLKQSKKVGEYQGTFNTATKIARHRTQPSPSSLIRKRPKKKSIAFKFGLVSLASLTLFALATWFYKPLHYPIHDFWVYTVQGKEDARGVSSDEIKIGMSAAFKGSAKELGRSMRLGISAYFDAVNERGGVHGRMLTLDAINDSYEPEQALNNINEFVKSDTGVLAMVGNVGTPTAKAMLPVALENNMLVLGTLSGASLLRNSPPDRYVFNYRASYAQETAAMVHYFVQTQEIDPRNIAIFHQNDSFGKDGAKGVLSALREYDIRPEAVLSSTYERNTARVEQAMFEFSAEMDTLQAIIIVGTYSASAAFTRELRNEGFGGKIANVSFVGARSLSELLLEFGPDYVENILITQVVPMYDAYAGGVIKYRDDMERFHPNEEPNFVSLEGYIVATIFVEALQRAGRYFNEEELIDRLESIKDLDLGIGASISFSPSNHQASQRVWGTIIKSDGSFEQIDL